MTAIEDDILSRLRRFLKDDSVYQIIVQWLKGFFFLTESKTKMITSIKIYFHFLQVNYNYFKFKYFLGLSISNK